MDTTYLFENVPINCIGVFDVAFSILRAHWKTIGKIAMLQFFSILATIIVLILVTLAFTATYIAAISDHIRNSTGGSSGYKRALFDSSIGLSGASRLLQTSSTNPSWFDMFLNDDDAYQSPDLDNNVILIMASLYVLWVIGLSLVSSVFIGAYNHALANVYGGIVPSMNRALKHGIDQMWTIFTFNILYAFAVTMVLFIFIGIPFLTGYPDSLNFGLLTLGSFFGLILWGVLSTLMTSATPSIVVEKKSALQAFGRSWSLCKSLFGFVLCTKIMFSLFVFVVSLFVNFFFDLMPFLFAELGHLFVSSAAHALEPVFAFVIYISLRVMNEHITSEDIANQISNGEDVIDAEAVELSDNTFSYRGDDKGSYSNIISSEERGQTV